MKLLLTVSTALLFTGCGYHVAGNSTILPPSAKIVAVVPFQNHSRTVGLSQSISAAVAQEFRMRTHYRIQATEAGSDLVLHGDVTRVEETPVVFNGNAATTIDIAIHLKVWLTTESTGKELYRNDDYVFHDQYQISSQEQNFFEEDTGAIQRMSNTIAQTVVASILEAF